MSAIPAIENYLEVKKYIDEDIVRLEPRPRDPEGKVKAALRFYDALGNPQQSFEAVQVAGTSGKGSVSAYIASILYHNGYTTGLHVSPYLQSFTEKIWINNQYADIATLPHALSDIRATIEAFRAEPDCPASVHGLASLGLCYELFRRAKVEWGVIETGVGGRFDLVQGLRRRLSVITDLGMDHVESLGPTLDRIAWHKAGILSGADLGLAVVTPGVEHVLRAEAEAAGTRLIEVVPEQLIERSARTGEFLGFRLPNLGFAQWPSDDPPSGFRLRNMAVAMAAADALWTLGLSVSARRSVLALSKVRFPGRFEVLQTRGVRVILDGAHNPQKVAALAGMLDSKASRVLVVGASGHRDLRNTVEAIPGHISAIVVARARLYGKAVQDPFAAVGTLSGLSERIEAVPEPEEAVERAVDLALSTGFSEVLVTGSLYMLGQARNVFYPWEQVCLQRTSFPVAEASHGA